MEELLSRATKGDIVEYTQSDGRMRRGRITDIVGNQIWATFQDAESFNYEKKRESTYITIGTFSARTARIIPYERTEPYDPTQQGDKDDDI
jgi:hypothetical protein